MAVLTLLMLAGVGCEDGSDEQAPPRGERPAEVNTAPDEGPEEDGPLGAGLFVFGDADLRATSIDHAVGSNPIIAWRTLEPEEGVYAWGALDAAIATAAASGSKIVPRVLTNASLNGQPAPDWFFNTAGAAYYYPSDEAESKGFKAPVAWDPVFQAKFGSFLRALGERYDGNPAIEFFQTNAGGGLYGEIVLTKDYTRFPAGWTPEAQRDSIVFWLDRWLEAFPVTNLSVMVNHVGDNIGQDAAAYAASRGVYLQQNTPWLPPEAVAIFLAHEASTKIILEAEDGCSSTDDGDFDRLIEAVFGYGFAIDYLHLCAESFWDESTAAKLPSIRQRLRD